MSTNGSTSPTADLLVKDEELLVTMTVTSFVGWVSITNGMVTAVGRGNQEPAAKEVLSARNCLVTPGLINTHHHIFQNLTRSVSPVVNADFLV